MTMPAPAPSPPTYRQIARAAGVSASTVSLALRAHPSIPAATREQVRRAAEAVGYRPNPLVTALMANLRAARRKKVDAVFALLTPAPVARLARVHPGALLVAEGARARARACGYALEEIAVDPLLDAGRDLTATLHARNVTGLLLHNLPELRPELRLDWSRYAVCSVGVRTAPLAFNTVSADHIQTMQLALDALLARGFRRVGLALARETCAVTAGRFEAAYSLLRFSGEGARLAPPLVAPELTEANFVGWTLKHALDAVVVADARAVRWLQNAGRRVPHDVAVVHTDAPPGWMPLAGVDQHHAEIGAAAVDLLVSDCNRNHRGPPARPLAVSIPGSWVEGPTIPPSA